MAGKNRPLTAKHERFCQLIASTVSPIEAYLQSGHKVSRRVASSNASRLLTKADIQERIAEIQAGTASRADFSRDDMAKWLIDGLMTPVSMIGEDHPLAQEVIETVETRTGRKKGEKSTKTVRRRVKSVGKAECGRMLMDLMGWKSPTELRVKTNTQEVDDIRERTQNMASAFDLIATQKQGSKSAAKDL